MTSMESMPECLIGMIPGMNKMDNTTVVFPEEVYSKYYNTAGNLVWVGVQSGEHLVILEN